MTKEELARKKGIKLPKETQSPSDSLVTTKPIGAGEDVPKTNASKKSKPPQTKNIEKRKSNPDPTPPAQQENISAMPEKRGPGKPRKRKDGDRKISFWLDEDLVNGLYSTLSYGESAGERINDAMREYQKAHKTYHP